MFGSGFWGAPLGNHDHLTQERNPPPRPTKLEFPNYVPVFRSQPLTRSLSSTLRHKICHSRTFQDISETDLESMNLCFEKDVSIDSLLPSHQFTKRPLLFDDELQTMLDEISVENEDAFREVLRMAPLPGHKKPKLAYARNFFGSLEDMARYFYDSMDNYYRVSTNSESSEATNSSQHTANSSTDVEMQDQSSQESPNHSPATKEVYKGYRIASGESLSPGTRISLLKNLLKTAMHRFQCRDHEPIPQPREKLIIRGVKIQSVQYSFCVARIPQDMKLARARQVEGPLMAVATRDELRFKEKNDLENPEKTPFVGERFDLFREVGCMLIVAAQRSRERKEQSSTREDQWWVTQRRWGGGPTKWGQLAIDVYEDEDPSWSPEERKLQEDKKLRQAEEKAKGIDAKALVSNAIGVEDLIADNVNSEAAKATALPGISVRAPSTGPVLPTDLDIRPRKKKLRSMERPPGDNPVTREGRRVVYVPPFKKKWYQDWEKLRPNTSMLDDKIIGKKVGAEQAEFDEVWLLTGVNTHVALVKMRVHPDYLKWLESGKEVPEEEVNGLKKNVLYVRRSTWFDMFDVEARKEFLLGLWRVFCWMNRDYVPKEEFEKMSQKQNIAFE